MKNLVLVLVIISLFASCRKSDHLSEIPHIAFVSFTANKDSSGKDTAAVVSFDYEDGDGDLGSLTNDSTAKNNLFIKLFEKKNGVFVEYVPVDTNVTFNATIPNLTPKAKDKSISGNIKNDQISLPLYVINDTIKLSIFIVDRADHHSNIIETSELVVTTQ